MTIGKPENREPRRSAGGDGQVSPIAFYLDPGSGAPVYRQLVVQVDQALRLGYLRVGDQLPRIKDVTRALAVNPDTVLKAYRELENQGIAAGRPGLGTFIVSAPDVAGLRELAGLRRDLQAWLRAAKAAGLDRNAAAALIASVLQGFDGISVVSAREDRDAEAGKAGGAA